MRYPLLLFAALLTALSTVYLGSLLYLPPQVHSALMLLVFIVLAALEFRSLRMFAATAPVPAFWHRPGWLWFTWLVLIIVALAVGAGFTGLQILIGEVGESIDYREQIGSGLMIASCMVLSNCVVYGFAGGTKAIQPEK